jgi:hypothetical protein
LLVDKMKLDVEMARKLIRDKKQLSNLSGVSYSRVKRAYTTGATGETVGKLAKALGVDVLDIIKDPLEGQTRKAK